MEAEGGKPEAKRHREPEGVEGRTKDEQREDGENRRNARALDAEGRDAFPAEDEQSVEEDVAERADKGAEADVLRVALSGGGPAENRGEDDECAGGLGLKIPGHLWNEKGAWGYAGTGEVVSREANQKHYLELMDKLIPLVRDGLAGTVYTQTTDVELEINGLMTYDRKVLKYDPEVLKAAHRKIEESDLQ